MKVPARLGWLRAVRSWLPWALLAVPVGLGVVTAAFVDLKPRVDENFFFASTDPQFQQAKEIETQFSAQSQLIVSVASTNIFSSAYLHRLGELTERLKLLGAVTSVRSLTDGPASPAATVQSPFWSRLLLGKNQESSNLVILSQGAEPQALIERLERIVREFDGPDFRIRLAGIPYVVEMIRRHLVHDFLSFSVTVFALFGGIMVVVFRSWRVFWGMLATCATAVLVTLLVQALFGKKIGILTVNLGTMVFVVTLSHLVYLTFNWQTLAARTKQRSLRLAWAASRMTFPASFWAMLCTALGFGSLLLVQARPLRELGFGGVIGAFAGLICAYGMYPTFLAWAVPHKNKLLAKGNGKFWEHRFVGPAIFILLGCVGLGFGLKRLNLDPNLLDYFKPRQPLREGLEYVDQHGGSNPLMLAVTPADGRPLNTPAAYQRLWRLQEALERQPGVGAVISLPVLMAEARRVPFAFFFSWETLFRKLEQSEYGQVASGFVTPDRQQGLFVLRMVESERPARRLTVVENLKTVVREEGFEPVRVGGVYYLQGQLSKRVAASLVTGLFWLHVAFVVIALIVARTFRGTVAMIITLVLVPLSMLGGVGFLRIPVDVISAPATNVCIGMAIDSMIHLGFSVRRHRQQDRGEWETWVAARKEQWHGIVYANVIVAAGFAIFALSNFPPTQRFGLVVVFGTLIDVLAILFVLPLLGGATWNRRVERANQLPAT